MYNDSSSNESKHESNLIIGQMISKTININSPKEYAAIPYFVSNGESLDCSNFIRKKI